MTSIRWGVVGVGRAGRARVDALREDPRAEIVCGWRGQPAAAGLDSADSLDALIEQVDAVAVCAPDTAHPALIRRALEADRHVLTEYPLAGSAADARALLGLAAQRERVLHVEHIELLTPTARWLRTHVAGRPLRHGRVRFTGPPREQVFSLAHSNLARLHRLADAIGGVPRLDRVTVPGPERLEALLVWRGAPIEVVFVMRPGAVRTTELDLAFEDVQVSERDGVLKRNGEPVVLGTGPRLFLADQLTATARILDGESSYVSDSRILDVLELADALAVAGS